MQSLWFIMWEPGISATNFVIMQNLAKKIWPADGATIKVTRLQNSHGFIYRRPWTPVLDFMAKHPTGVDIFQSGPKWLTAASQKLKKQPWDTPIKNIVSSAFVQEQRISTLQFSPEACDVSFTAAAIFTSSTLRHTSWTSRKQNCALRRLPQKHDHQILCKHQKDCTPNLQYRYNFFSSFKRM